MPDTKIISKKIIGFQKWLQKYPLLLVIYLSTCAFVIYTCMYGFRKPYTVGIYKDIYFLGISYKICLVIAQVLGYMVSKFFGIKFIACMQPSKRALYIVLSILIAWLSLFVFAIVPAPYNLICMFINGLPLGIIFGLVFGFLEGRKTTEIMGAVLASSFIFGSGIAKFVGKLLLQNFNIAEKWMPFVAGGIFILPLFLFVLLLAQSPLPSQMDIDNRTQRNPMNAIERKKILQQFGFALIPVIISYAVFTIARDFCEDFANDLWTEAGYKNISAIFSQTSIITSLIVLVILGSFFLIKNNQFAFKSIHVLIGTGVLLSLLATVIFQFGLLSVFAWMVIATTGLYISYLAFNCIYFERMIATYKLKSNVGFVMYIADAFGYLGTVMVLLIKEFIPIKYNWVHFFSFLFYATAVAGLICIAISLTIHSKLIKKLCNNSQPS